jgi:DnaK suppressor protein
MTLGPDEARALLHARLKALAQEDALGSAATAPVTLEQDSVGRLSRIDAMQMQAMALAAQRRRASEKLQIEAALRRLDGDDYGYCLACGDEIAEARLRHNPAVTKCIDCAD